MTKGRFIISFIVEADFQEEISHDDACEVVEEAVTRIIDDAATGRQYTMHGGDLHGVSVKLDDFVNFSADLDSEIKPEAG